MPAEVESRKDQEFKKYLNSLSSAYDFLFPKSPNKVSHKSYDFNETQSPLSIEDLLAHNITVWEIGDNSELSNDYGNLFLHFFHNNDDGSVKITLIGSTRPKIFQGAKEATDPNIYPFDIQPWYMIDMPRERFVPHIEVGSMHVGSEIEVSTIPGSEGFSESLKEKLLSTFSGDAIGTITGEVTERFVEVNTKPSLAELGATQRNFAEIFHVLSNLTNPVVTSLDPFPDISDFPDNQYVRDFMGPYLADNALNIGSRLVTHINTYGQQTILLEYNESNGREKGTPITINDLQNSKLRQLIVCWFTPLATHTHVELPKQCDTKYQEIKDYNSSAFITNAKGHGPDQVLNLSSLSSFSLNGHLPTNPDGSQHHDAKRQHRTALFQTSKYQHPIQSNSTAIPHIANSIRNHAPSITRALTGRDEKNERWHGAYRLRGEMGTTENLSHDSTVSVELISSLNLMDAIGVFILEHLYKEGTLGKYGFTMDELRRFYAIPDMWNPQNKEYYIDFQDHELVALEDIYEVNRLNREKDGFDGIYYAPDGFVTTHKDQLANYLDFVTRFFERYEEVSGIPGIDVNELNQVKYWVLRSTEEPSSYSISNYLDPDSEDYMKGTMGAHLWEETRRLANEVLENGYCQVSYNGEGLVFQPEDLESFRKNAETNYFPELITWYVVNMVQPSQKTYIDRKYHELTEKQE